MDTLPRTFFSGSVSTRAREFSACTLCIPVAATTTVSLEYYHMDRCLDCKLTDPLIADLEGAYDGILAIEWIDVETLEGWERWNAYEFFEVPAVVVDGTFKIPKEEITGENLRVTILPATCDPTPGKPGLASIAHHKADSPGYRLASEQLTCKPSHNRNVFVSFGKNRTMPADFICFNDPESDRAPRTVPACVRGRPSPGLTPG